MVFKIIQIFKIQQHNTKKHFKSSGELSLFRLGI